MVAVLRTALFSIALVSVWQTPSQDDVKARIAEAAALSAKRAFADALKILEPLATHPAVTADKDLSADVAYQLGNVYFLQNEYPKALEALGRSLSLSRERADRTREGRALFRYMQTYKNLGQYATSLERGNELITLAQALKNTDLEARTRTVLGGVLDLMGRFQEALESYRTAERLYNGSTALPAIQLMNETAITYKNLGHYDAALALYKRAYDGYVALGSKLDQAIALNNSGNLYRLLGQDDQALENYQQALAICRELNERRGMSISLSAIGNVLLERGDTARAMTFFSEQVEITKALGNRNEQSIAFHNLADVHAARGEFDEAAKYYDEAIAIQRSIGARVREGTTNIAYAEARLKQGRPEAAATLAAASLSIAREAQSPDLEWRALQTGAKAARAQNHTGDAIDMLRKSAAIVNDLRANISTDTGKIGFVDGRQAVFHELAAALVSARRHEEGLEAAEAGRARAFADLLAQRRVEGKPAERQDLAAVRAALDESRASGPPPPGARAAGTRGGALDDRLASLRADHAELASLLTADSPTTAEITQTARRLNATLVEYLVTEKALLAWVVTPHGRIEVAVVDIPGLTLQARVDEMRTLLASDSTTGPPPARLTALARELNRTLITPIDPFLPGPNDQVIIIPHGPLAMLPFAALEDSRGRPLVEHYTLSFAPAISVFRYTTAKRGQSPASSASALVVADAAGPAEAGMPALPGAREEGRLVAAQAKRLAPAGVSLVVGPAATESAFKRDAGSRRLVHVATHGLISATRPLRSSLLLAPGDGEDGYLRVDEIFGLSLSADLVVLSGCSTGLGQPSGDGIIGLGRAFIYAGTPAVVVSQWDVSDRATAFLMDRFYAALASGRGPAAALRTAQLAARERYPHPALWAAFVTIGEPR